MNSIKFGLKKVINSSKKNGIAAVKNKKLIKIKGNIIKLQFATSNNASRPFWHEKLYEQKS